MYNSKLKVPDRFWGAFFFPLVVYGLMACDNRDPVQERPAYNPAVPIALSSFFPDSGRIREKVILEGTNFGSDPSKIRVYFNKKRAAVVGSTGSRMYAIVPRMPGDTCTVAVAAGAGQLLGFDSVVYESRFRYRTTVSVTTVCGNGTMTNRTGALEQALISPFQLDVDGNGNIFVSVENGFEGGNSTDVGFVKINEEENKMELISNLGSGSDYGPRFEGINVDKTSSMIYTVVRNVGNSFVSMDPAEYWMPKTKSITWVVNPIHPEYTFPGQTSDKYLGYNQYDKFLYTRFTSGHVVRIDPKTGEGMVLYRTPQSSGTTLQLDFNPKHPEMMYIAGYTGSGVAHGIWQLNVNDPDNSWRRLNAPTSAGHRDGPISQAMFNGPIGLCFDSEGICYITDLNNHCLRSYNPETGMVSTIAGIPGKADYKDGGRDEALFHNPSGVAVDHNFNVYIADRLNRRVRKIAVE